MKYKYGTFEHVINSTALTVDRQTVYDPRGRPDRVRVQHTISGWLEADGATPQDRQDDLTTKIDALKAAYATDNQDAGLLLDDGSESSHQLKIAGAMQGVRVIQQPYFPRGDGAEYATKREYIIRLEAEYEVPPLDGILVEFRENVTVIGNGGPTRVVVPLISSIHQLQQTSVASLTRAVQQGFAVGKQNYPDFPHNTGNLLFDAALEVGAARRLSYDSGERVRSSTYAYRNFVSRWSYEFLGNAPFSGAPNLETTVPLTPYTPPP